MKTSVLDTIRQQLEWDLQRTQVELREESHDPKGFKYAVLKDREQFTETLLKLLDDK